VYPSRKKFQTQDLPSDPQLWAIGVIVVRWSSIESLTAAFILGLTDDETPERTTFETTWSWSARLEQLVGLATERLMQPWQNRILEILAEVRSVQDLRDKIVHSQWGGPQNKDFVGPDAQLFNWTKPQPTFSWNLSFGELMRIAYRIDNLQMAIFNFYIGEKETTPAIVTLSDALRHRRRMD
jgi:hypothetical protein